MTRTQSQTSPHVVSMPTPSEETRSQGIDRERVADCVPLIPEAATDSILIVAEGEMRWTSVEELGQASLVTLARIRDIIEEWRKQSTPAYRAGVDLAALLAIETELNKGAKQ